MEETVIEFYFIEASIYLGPYLDLFYVIEIFFLGYCKITPLRDFFRSLTGLGIKKIHLIVNLFRFRPQLRRLKKVVNTNLFLPLIRLKQMLYFNTLPRQALLS